MTRTLGGVTFEIPKGYLDTFSGYGGQITLHALLPDMEPETGANADQFNVLWNGKGFGRVVRIVITVWGSDNLTGEDLLKVYQDDYDSSVKGFPQFSNPWEDRAVTGGGFVYHDAPPLGRDIFSYKEPDYTFVVDCSRYSDVPSPECQVRDKVGVFLVEYLYSRDYAQRRLSNVLDIDGRVRRLLRDAINLTDKKGVDK